MYKMLLIALLLILPLAQVGADESRDLLLVTVSDNLGENIELNLYNPATDVSTPVLTDYNNYSRAILSADGRLAFSSPFEGRMTAQIQDTKHLDQPIRMVTDRGEDNEYPLAWSPYGRKLAYESVLRNGHALIFLWDGESAINITPQAASSVTPYQPLWSRDGRNLAFVLTDANDHHQLYVWDGTAVTSVDVVAQETDYSTLNYYDMTWSSDGRLAFRVAYNSDHYVPTEIYLWDGHSTMNVSQNPTGGDFYPVWSADGQLAYQAEWDMDYNILVWDGMSMKDGQPDASTFVKATPYLNRSIPTWTSARQVAYAMQMPKDRHPQVYVWDGQTATNISQNPTIDNFTPVWSDDGHWAYMAHSSTEEFLMVRDADNQTLLMTQAYGYVQPVWSSNNALMFCRMDQSEWVLAVWDGQVSHEVAHGASVRGQWQSGASLDCFTR